MTNEVSNLRCTSLCIVVETDATRNFFVHNQVAQQLYNVTIVVRVSKTKQPTFFLFENLLASSSNSLLEIVYVYVDVAQHNSSNEPTEET